jgi:hypothetical protein
LPEKMSHPNPEAGIYPLKRDYYMADYNSLRMDTMLLPTIMHRIAPVSHRVIQYQHWLQIHGETIAASIGLIPAVGFMLGLSFIFLGVRRRENSLIPFMPAEIDNVLRHFSAANLWLLLIGISSGFGVLIATIFPDIRCYMRVCLYILFFSLLIFCLVVDYGTSRFFPRKNMIIAWGLAVLLAAFGLWDQTGTGEAFMMGESPLNKPAVEAKLERYRINDAFIRKVEQELPPGAMVFELPYLSFWTYDGPANHVEYDQLVPYLHSKKLKWSYGSIVGTAVDLWQRHAVRKPMEDFLREISTMGFSAVYVDREGYADNGDSIVAQLHDHLNTEPLVSADGRRLVFKLTSVGFVVKVDPYTYWPRTLTITDRALFSPSALPDYVFADKLAATLQRHAEPQVTLKGAELEGVLDHDMLKVLTSYSHEPMPDAAFKGNLSCADNAVVTLAAADHRAYYTLPLTITNDSDFWWNFDAGRVLPLSVRSHLLDADRKMKDVDYIYQVFVATPIRPHSSKTVQAVFSTHFLKTLEGIHYVQLDIVQEGVAWMTGKTGNKLCTIKTQNTEGLLGHEGP